MLEQWSTMKKKLFSLGIAALMLGCSNSSDTFYETFKCVVAAGALGRDAEQSSAAIRLERLTTSEHGDTTRLHELMKRRIRDEYDLANNTTKENYRIFMKIYESRQCQGVYKS